MASSTSLHYMSALSRHEAQQEMYMRLRNAEHGPTSPSAIEGCRCDTCSGDIYERALRREDLDFDIPTFNPL